jgi:hypothetical protein
MQLGLCDMGLSWYRPSPLHFGQHRALPGTTPVPEQPAQTVQKMQPLPCGMELRWTLPAPPHWKQACADGAAAVAAQPDTGTPQREQKLLSGASGAPQDEQNMGVSPELQ